MVVEAVIVSTLPSGACDGYHTYRAVKDQPVDSEEICVLQHHAKKKRYTVEGLPQRNIKTSQLHEAYNAIISAGYIRMKQDEEKKWMDIMNQQTDDDGHKVLMVFARRKETEESRFSMAKFLGSKRDLMTEKTKKQSRWSSGRDKVGKTEKPTKSATKKLWSRREKPQQAEEELRKLQPTLESKHDQRKSRKMTTDSSWLGKSITVPLCKPTAKKKTWPCMTSCFCT